MKFNFRKIASVLASTVMVGSSVALAAAANYPAPFVQSGKADVAIVWGTNSAPTDLVAVTDITTSLSSALAKQTASGTSTTGSTASGGDFVKLEKSTNRFNLGESMNDFYTSLDNDELAVVLTDGTYTNDDNDDFDFTQKIELRDVTLQHFQDSEFNDDKPVIGFDLVDGQDVLNYTLDFTPDNAEGGTGFTTLETTEITMLGRNYYVVDVSASNANAVNGVKMTLLDAANSAIVTEGETKTVSVGSDSFDVKITFVDEDEAILEVNGVATNKLNEGDVFKVKEDTYVAVKNILYSAKDTGVSKVEFSIGSGKIVLETGQEVEINSEDVSDIDEYNDASVKSYIYNSTTDIDKIVLEWELGDDTWIAAGSDLVLPGFETIKLSMGGFVVPSKEKTSIANDGDDSIRLSTVLEDGAVEFNLLYLNASGFTGLGKDSDDQLVVTNSTVINFDKDTDKWFVASWINGDDAESYLLEVTDINSSKSTASTTSVKSLGSGKVKDIDLNEAEDFGEVTLTLNAANEAAGTARLTISASSGAGTVSFDRLYTNDGLRVMLPRNHTLANVDTTNPNGVINISANPTTFVLNFTEEDEDGNIGSGTAFQVTLGKNSDNEAQVSSVSVTDYETTDNSDNFVGYVNSTLATMTSLETGSDQDSIEIEYHGDESYAEVFVSESGVAISGGNSSSVSELGSIAVSDSEVSSVSSKNLIVVGGSCVNTVAAELLGASYPLCGADFEAKSGAGSGAFLIQTFSRSGGKVATLVAGYNAEDTTKAAKYLTTQTVDTMVGKKYKGTSATVATVETTTA